MTRTISQTRLQMAQYPKGDDRLVITREALGQLIDVSLWAWKRAEADGNTTMEGKARDTLAGVRRALGRPEADEHLWDADDDDMSWDEGGDRADDDEPWDEDDEPWEDEEEATEEDVEWA